MVSTISLMYLFVRFCVGKSLIANLRNKFVLRHFIYVTFYTLCFLPNKLNELYVLLDKEPIMVEYSILINLSMGFVMFLIRASETNFYNKLFCYRLGGDRNKSSLDITTDKKVMYTLFILI